MVLIYRPIQYQIFSKKSVGRDKNSAKVTESSSNCPGLRINKVSWELRKKGFYQVRTLGYKPGIEMINTKEESSSEEEEEEEDEVYVSAYIMNVFFFFH